MGEQRKEEDLTIDSVRDFRELTEIKPAVKDTGIVIVAGGVPKNFTQDVVVATDILGEARPMHKYAIQFWAFLVNLSSPAFKMLSSIWV